MKKKIILSIVLILIVAIFILVYMHNKQIKIKHDIKSEYVTVLFKKSIYPAKILVKKGTTLNEALLKLYTIDHNHYDTFLLNKEAVSGNFKIFKDCIFTVK